LPPLLVRLAILGAASPSRAVVPPADPPAGPPADPPAKKELKWDDQWPRFRPVEFVLTGEAAPAAIAEYWLAAPQSSPHWTQGNPFEDAIRNALRLRSAGALRAAWTAASAVDVSLIVLTVGLDSIVVPFARGSTDVGVQLGLMDCESFALSSIVTISLYDNVGRARPSYADCQANPTSAPTVA
jgi:hypothetical protein